MGLLTNKIKSFFDYYIDSSLHVSLCVIFYIVSINLSNQIHPIWEDLTFVLFTTFFTYNFIKFYELLVSKNKPISFLLKIFFLKASFALIIALYLFFNLSISKQIIVTITAFVTVLYTIPIVQNFTLRNNPILKIITVAFCWTMLTVIFPFVEILELIDLIYYSLLIFCLVIAQIIPFEIRDVNKDKNYVKTIVHEYGIKNSKGIGYFALIFIFITTITLYFSSSEYTLKYSILLTILIVTVLLNFASKKQGKYYSSFVVESVPMYWLLIELGLQFIV